MIDPMAEFGCDNNRRNRICSDSPSLVATATNPFGLKVQYIPPIRGDDFVS